MDDGNAYRSAVIDALRKDGWEVNQGETAHGGMGVGLILSRQSPETGRRFTVPFALHEGFRNLDANDPATWLETAKKTAEDDRVFWSGGSNKDSFPHVMHDIDRFKTEHLSRIRELVGEAVAAVERSHGIPLVRDWYRESYPDDELGRGISPALTFQQAFDAVKLGGGFYDALGVGDSLVRERVFQELSVRTGIDYGGIYGAWLGENPLPNFDSLGETSSKVAVGAGYSFNLFDDSLLTGTGIDLKGTGTVVTVDGKDYPLMKGATFKDSQRVDALLDAKGDLPISEYRCEAAAGCDLAAEAHDARGASGSMDAQQPPSERSNPSR